MNIIVTLLIYLLLVSSGLWAVQTKLNLLPPKEKIPLKFQAWTCRVLLLVPGINLFIWLWVVTEGLEPQCPQAWKSWTGGG